MHQQKVRVVGEKASLEWWDEFPNQLRYEEQGQPVKILERGMSYLDPEDSVVNDFRIGGGHAEGFFDAWANIYSRFGKNIDQLINGAALSETTEWYPDAEVGVEGVRFIENCVRSADNGEVWVDYL